MAMPPSVRVPTRPGASLFPTGAHALSVAVVAVLLLAALAWVGLVAIVLHRAL